jgi:hypothetical protein
MSTSHSKVTCDAKEEGKHEGGSRMKILMYGMYAGVNTWGVQIIMEHHIDQ